MTIDEAFTEIRKFLPRDKRTVGITCSIHEYDHIPDHREIQFQIWDGREIYTASTLEAAVQKCLEAPGTIEDAQEFVSEVQSATQETAR